jgi:hypothetical protein
MDGPSHTSRFTVQCIQVVVCASTGSEARIVVEESRNANGLGGGGEEFRGGLIGARVCLVSLVRRTK